MAIRTQHPIDERAFGFLRINDRGSKPRKHGITEIRGPYYSPLGKRHLEDILETMGNYVDALKFAGGSFSLMPRQALGELISLCHEHNVMVSTGGFIEHVLTQGSDAVNPEQVLNRAFNLEPVAQQDRRSSRPKGRVILSGQSCLPNGLLGPGPTWS